MHSKIVAQRFYELSAEQGSASSELRLGDYAYHGWGVSTEVLAESEEPTSSEDDDESQWPSSLYGEESEVVARPQKVDFEASIARYRKTAELTVTGEWMQAFVARGSFNLGFMHQFGLGVAQDLHMTKRHYHRSREVDPGGNHAAVTVALMGLGAHMFWLRVPPAEILLKRLMADIRIHLVIIHIIGIAALLAVRCTYGAPPSRPPASRPRSLPTSPARGAQPANLPASPAGAQPASASPTSGAQPAPASPAGGAQPVPASQPPAAGSSTSGAQAAAAAQDDMH